MVLSENNQLERRIEKIKPGPEAQFKLRFETLISELSTKFINLPVEKIDQEIEASEKQICEFLNLDIASLWQWKPDSAKFLTLTHYYRRFDGPPVPNEMNSDDFFPWCGQQLKEGKTVAFFSTTQAPETASRDKEIWDIFGVKSVLIIPLSMGGGPTFGALAFNTVTENRHWPKALIDRLHLVAQMYANALARKNFEQNLILNEERLSLATDFAGVGIWSLKLSTGIYWLTKKAREIFGVSLDETVTLENILLKAHPDDRAMIENHIQTAIHSGNEERLKYRVLLPEGGLRWVSTRGRIRFDSKGQADHFTGISLDITERVRAGREMEIQRQEMAHISRIELLSQLSSSMAHELNQPLSAILTNAQVSLKLINQLSPDIDDMRNIITDIVSDTKRASHIVARLRSWLKKEVRTACVCKLDSLIEETMVFLRSEAMVKGVELVLDIAPNLPSAFCDKIQIQQVLVNLVKNAWETEHGLLDQKSQRICIRLNQENNDFLKVSIEDDGAGIPNHMINNLFQPFVTTKPDGLGMGLSICKGIINSHNGHIWAQNNQHGRGATFNFTLPLVKEPEL